MKLAPLTDRVFGVKVWYDTGVIAVIPRAQLETEWPNLPKSGVQVLSIYDSHTLPGFNGENMHLAQYFASHDYYWFEPGVGFGETNRPDEIPVRAWVLSGREMDKDNFRNLYNEAMQDHIF